MARRSHSSGTCTVPAPEIRSGHRVGRAATTVTAVRNGLSDVAGSTSFRVSALVPGSRGRLAPEPSLYGTTVEVLPVIDG